MAYQETNELLNELPITPEEAIARRDAQVEHHRLKKAGRLKQVAKKILAKPPKEG